MAFSPSSRSSRSSSSRSALAAALIAALAGFGSGCSKRSESTATASDGVASGSVAPGGSEGSASSAVSGGSGGSGRPEPKASPPSLTAAPWNVLLISIDSLRADMPWAGYERPIAPRLTELYGRSTAYTRAYATSSFTSKSLAGLLTGRYPSELARTGTFFTRYLTPKDFLCTSLAAMDTPCVAGHAHAYFGPKTSGYEHGFTEWKLVPGIPFDYQTDPHVTSAKLTPLAIEMLSDVAKRNRPFFAWFHYMDPHDEYKSHTESPHFGKRPRDLYDEEVFFTDLWIGKLLDFVESQPWATRTVIVVTADHGEAFGEHGMTRHAHELWEELIHVPLFFFIPGRAARVIDEPRSHVDLAPTFAELLHAKVDLPWNATSLAPELSGGQAPPRDVIADLPEDEYNERRRAIIHGTTKLVSYGNDARLSLFDLANDPGEKKDLVVSDKELANDMRRRYKDAQKKIADVSPTGGIPKRDAAR